MSLSSREHSSPPRVTHWSGIPNPLALAHWVATSPLIPERAVFVCTDSPAEATIVLDVLPVLAPHRRVLLWSGDSYGVAGMLEPAAEGVIITDRETLTTYLLPSKQQMRKNGLRLEVHKESSIAHVKTWLTEAGFARERTANAAGRYAVRGAVIDVYTDQPYRFEWDGDRISSISSFELATGATGTQLAHVLVVSPRASGRSSLLTLIPRDVLTIFFHTEPAATTGDQWIVDAIDVVIGNAPAQDVGYRQLPSYRLRPQELLRDAQRMTQVLVWSAFPEKARAVLAAAHPVVHPVAIQSTGVVNALTGVVMLTDDALGFAQEKRKKQSRRMTQALIQSLSPGDYVVHVYHGIARFSGMTQMHVNKLLREYFVLEFAGNDKIYVPVELSDRIDTYIGDPHPHLHRLSDASWHEVVARVKAQAVLLAHELLGTAARRATAHAPVCVPHSEEQALDAACPFTLTRDQQRALDDLFADLGREKPMDRLLCGDVGFGKTEVALRAAFRAVLSGYQVALLAPTTVLVQQHTDTFVARLKNFGVQVGMLSRFQTKKEQQQVVEGLHNGSIDIVIGTHRLVSHDVRWKRLGCIIIDEEQRFGVQTKERLLKMRANAHVLTMTATPIPRTLNVSLSGIRDISTILTPPQERKAVTVSVARMDSQIVQRAIQREYERGGQTYYIYNHVQSIERRKRELQSLAPHARIEIAHGQMNAHALAAVMHAFDIGEVDVLLATTIVENGLDIPTANTLIVENATHFGLAELYQLKGRVGRSRVQGYAYFLFSEQRLDHDARERLIALKESTRLGAGFELAMKDMEIRGVGNILGREQHGHAVKIGLNLYVRLLHHAVEELQGVAEEPPRDIPIDLPLEARIPESVISEESERVLLYLQLANIVDLDELSEQRARYTADYHFAPDGLLSPECAGLFDLLEIKLLASRSALLSIATTYPNPQNRLTSPRITLTTDTPFTELPAPWKVVQSNNAGGCKARATLADLGTDWVKKLKVVISS